MNKYAEQLQQAVTKFEKSNRTLSDYKDLLRAYDFAKRNDTKMADVHNAIFNGLMELNVFKYSNHTTK